MVLSGWIQIGFKEEFSYSEGGEILEQVSWRGDRMPHPWKYFKVGQMGSEQAGIQSSCKCTCSLQRAGIYDL